MALYTEQTGTLTFGQHWSVDILLKDRHEHMLKFTFKLSLTYFSNTIDYYLQHSIIGLTYYNNNTTTIVPEACPHPRDTP
jgi:hypothetical protein